MKLIINVKYTYIWLAIVAGTLFYDMIGTLGFTLIDELLVLFITILNIVKNKFNKEFLAFCFISIFYLAYSFIINITHEKAILVDFFIQIKPFLIFYCLASLRFKLNSIHKIKIKRLIIYIIIGTLIASCLNYHYFMWQIMGHPSRYATLFIILGFGYYYCSHRKKKDVYITLAIWCISIFSFRSKAYGFFAIAFITLLFIKDKEFYRHKIKSIILIIISSLLILIIVWSKFSFYFIQGISNENKMFARPLLYINAFKIMNDYFPFGSGLGTYATHASAIYYSPLYYKYGLNNMHGLSPNGSFISDTYFPVYAQFGYVGLILLFFFFNKRYKRIILSYKIHKDFTLFKIQILFLMFFFIESMVDSTLIQNRGIVMMILFTLFYNEMRDKTFIYNENTTLQ